ncbi:MAG: tetratricopeptide repeat protein [Rhodospirillaceae bacterium]|nr:tetratricopeptide repeat protein [Rhodospirillaceae bacterium]
MTATQAAQPLSRPPELNAVLHRARSGDIAGAESECRAYLAVHPNSGWAQDTLGLIYSKAMRVNLAKAAFSAAVASLNPDLSFFEHLSQAWMAMHAPLNAAHVLHKALTQLGSSLTPATVHRLQADLAIALGHAEQSEQAQTLCEKLIALAPSDAKMWAVYARAMFAAGQSGPALTACEKAKALDPNSIADTGLIYANLLSLYGRADEAAAVRKTRFELIGDDTEARLKEIDALEREGAVGEAEDLWRKSLASDQPPAPLYTRLAQNLLRQNQTAAALSYLDKAKASAPDTQTASIIRVLERSAIQHSKRVAELAGILPVARPYSTDNIIVIRGAVEPRFMDTIKYNRAAYPNCAIVLSTWRSTDSCLLNQLGPYVDDIVLNDRPDMPGSNNINYQIACAAAGVARACELQAKRILVTRTDIAFLAPNVLGTLSALIDAERPEAARAPNLSGRLVICDLFTLLAPLYHASDIFCYGLAEDVAKYWSTAHMTDACRRPEVILVRGFAQAVGRTLKNDVADSLAALQNLFIVQDSEALGLYWQKYPAAAYSALMENTTLVSAEVWSGKRAPLLNVQPASMPQINLVETSK